MGEAQAKDLVDVSFGFDREQICRRQTGTVRLAVRLRVKDQGDALQRPPLCVALALDVSASMAGVPLQQVLRSTQRIAELLGPADRLGVVAFSDGAFEVAPLQSVDEHMRRQLGRTLSRLSTLAQTNVEAGLRAAQHMLAGPFSEQRRIIVLLSDGQPNVGARHPTDLALVARACSATISTLGYGPHHDDRILGAISDAGRGSYAFVADPQLCRVELARAIGGRADAVIERVTARIAPVQGVRLVSVTGPRTPIGGQESLVELPDLRAGEQTVVAATLVIEPSRDGSRREVADVAVSFSRPGRDQPPCHVSRRLEIALGDADAAPRPEIVHDIVFAEARQGRREACRLADEGRFDEAGALLRELCTKIRNVPDLAGNADLCEALEQLVDDADLMSRRPDEAMYAAFRRGQRDIVAGVAGNTKLGRELVDDAIGRFPRAELVVIDGPTHASAFVLRADNLVGRTSIADICLPDGSVSRCHARITATSGAFWLVDLGSTNTTRLNGRPVHKARLAHGDELDLGCWRLRYAEPT